MQSIALVAKNRNLCVNIPGIQISQNPTLCRCIRSAGMSEFLRDCIQNTLQPLGVAVVIEASHTCMTLRGVQKANAVTTTSAFSGIFLKDERTRNEFLNLIR